MKEPGYLHLLQTGQLEKRVAQLKEMLKNCVLCPHQCQVDRTSGEKGYCRTLEKTVVSGGEAHFGEERELVGRYGSGTIFFSHCNLKCVFCQNYEISCCGLGQEMSGHQLADMMLALQRKGCHNINLVSPGHIIPQIVEAIYIAANRGLQIPIVYNSNGYDLTDSLRLLKDIIDIYLPDLKFADDEKAYRYMGVKHYYTIAKEALREMHDQVGGLWTDDNNVAYRGLMIRHLVLPENLADTDKIMDFIVQELGPDTYVNIMAQYYPAHQAYNYPELSRSITKKEYQQAVSAAKAAGLKGLVHSL